MNVFLSVIVIAFGTAVGIYFSRKLRERERLICASVLLIKELAVQIKYTNSEIGSMLQNAAKNEAYEKLLFVTACGSIKVSGDFHQAWYNGVKKQPYLTSRDRELLFALGQHLGETDLDGQLSFLEMTEGMMSRQQEEAAEDYSRKGRMYRSVGILCGLAAGIMVL